MMIKMCISFVDGDGLTRTISRKEYENYCHHATNIFTPDMWRFKNEDGSFVIYNPANIATVKFSEDGEAD